MKLNKFMRGLALVLSLVMLVTALPAISYADAVESIVDDLKEDFSEKEVTETEENEEILSDSKGNRYKRVGSGIYEVVSEREENVKHIRYANGEYTAIVYDYPVHRLDENGLWQDIDNSIEESASAALSEVLSESNVIRNNASSPYKTKDGRVSFGKDFDSLIKIEENGYKIEFGLDSAAFTPLVGTMSSGVQSLVKYENRSDPVDADEKRRVENLEKISSKLKYENIFGNTDIEYELISNNVKENIIIKSGGSSVYAYTFVLSLENLEIVQNDNGSVTLRDSESKEDKYVIPAPYMYDNAGEYSYSAAYVVRESADGEYSFTIVADPEWINAEERVFPITLDPSIQVASDNTNTLDTYVSQALPTTSYGSSSVLVAGEETDGKDNVIYIKTPVPTLPEGAALTKAYISLYLQSVTTYNSAHTIPLGIYTVENTLTENTTWNDYSNTNLSEHPIGYKSVHDYQGQGYVSFNVTEKVKGIYLGADNNGFAIKAEESTYTKATFESSESYSHTPVFTVEYRIQSGLEDYFSYSSQGVGLAGTGYVNNKTGDLLLSASFFSTTDDIMPYAPFLMYSGADVYEEGASYERIADKWTLSSDSYVKRIDYTDPITNSIQTKYVYRDSDGTIHYFYGYTVTDSEGNVTTEYIDEDGLGLTLKEITVGSANKNYEILNDAGDKLLFNYDGYLTKQIDRIGNERLFERYGSQLYRVLLKPFGESAITQINYSYTSSGRLEYIDYPQQNKRVYPSYTTVTYTENGSTVSFDLISGISYRILSSGSYAEYASASYIYDSTGRLTEIRDNFSGYRAVYTYTDGKISSVTEYKNSAQGQTIGFTYEVERSEIRSSGSDDIYGNDDDFLSHLIFDDNLRVVTTYTTDLAKTNIYGVSTGKYLESEDTEEGELSPKQANKIKGSSSVGVPEGGILDDGSFDSYSGNWSYVYLGGAYAYYTYSGIHGGSVAIRGSVTGSGYVTRVIENPEKASGYTLSAWANAPSLAREDGAFFCIWVFVNYSDESYDQYVLEFSSDTNDKQFGSTSISVNSYKTVDNIEIMCDYSNNVGIAYFDDITLIEDPTSVKYVYDSEGNIVRSLNREYESSESEYNEDNLLTKITYNDGSVYEYTYTESNLPLTEKYKKNGNTVYTTTYSYNDYGQTERVSTTGTSIANSMEESYEYADDSAYFGKLVSETNTEGETTTYSYNGTGIHCGLLAYTVGNDSKGYSYYYDNLGRLMWVYPTEVSGDIAYNEYSNEHADYTYTGNELTSIESASTEYNFVYDSFGNRSAVKVGNGSIVSYEYNPYNGKLKKINYANGYSLEYVYDSLERVKEIYETIGTASPVKIYSYTYRNDGNVSECVDYKSGQRYNYVYDNNGRVTRTKVYNLSDSNNYIYSSENTYDEDSKISSQTREYFYGNTIAQEAYTYVYDTRDRLTRVRRNESEYTSYSYDALSRVYSVSQSYFGNSSQIQYYYGYATVNSKSTNRVSSFMTTLYSSSSMTNTSYSYTYDDVGRITEIRINGTLTYSYEYDNLGQLVRENNLPANKTYVYIYDNAGNRVYRYTYAYTTGATTSSPSTNVYYYNNSNWGDLLTSANGVNISYDAIGNPTAIGNVSLTWQGRRLVQYGNYTYTYNADGIRTSKTVNNVTHNYVLEGSNILAETYDGTTLRFVYDNTGIIGLYYNGTLYMYEKNLQGDVVAILNSSLTRVVEYYYDAWGNILSTSGSMASTLGAANPIRYRSYYYDTETGWYYLQSRYYNPAWGRFVSADNYVNANGDLIGFNMFAYCSNNPVMFVDPCGTVININNSAAFLMLLIWLYGGGEDIYFNNDSLIAKEFKSSKKMNEEIEKCLDIYKTTGQSYFTGRKKITGFSDFDIWMAVRSFNYEILITEEKNETGFWFWKKTITTYNVEVKIWDRYNFDSGTDSGDGMGSVLNNMAYKLHQKGYGEDYDFEIHYTKTYNPPRKKNFFEYFIVLAN